MFWFFFAILAITVASVANAGTLPICLLNDTSLQPFKIVYQIDSFPLTFEVRSDHKNADDVCKQVNEAQFGIIAVYGKNNGINIVPSWGDKTGKYNVDIFFIQNGTKADNASFIDLPFPTGQTQKIIYNITIDYNSIKIVSKNDAASPKFLSMDSAYLPDFIERKYLSLAFFQPLQTSNDSSAVNNCNLFLNYNGKFVWQPPTINL
uniref:Uncharacterized protein n=1 Tax=Panagrolaimus sp. PS1159 TaxID=55785 RepID=A0AC35FQQ3_9BILA